MLSREDYFSPWRAAWTAGPWPTCCRASSRNPAGLLLFTVGNAISDKAGPGHEEDDRQDDQYPPRKMAPRFLLNRFGSGLTDHRFRNGLDRRRGGRRRLFHDRLRLEFHLARQIGDEVGALEEQQGQAGVDDHRAGIVLAVRPVAGRLLVRQQEFGPPGIPVLAFNQFAVIEHTDPFDRPEEVEVGAREVLDVAHRLAEDPLRATKPSRMRGSAWALLDLGRMSDEAASTGPCPSPEPMSPTVPAPSCGRAALPAPSSLAGASCTVASGAIACPMARPMSPTQVIGGLSCSPPPRL